MPPLACLPLTEFTGGRPGGSANWCGSSPCFNSPKYSLPPMPTVSTRTCSFGGFLPIIIKGDQLSLQRERIYKTVKGALGAVFNSCAGNTHLKLLILFHLKITLVVRERVKKTELALQIHKALFQVFIAPHLHHWIIPTTTL